MKQKENQFCNPNPSHLQKVANAAYKRWGDIQTRQTLANLKQTRQSKKRQG